ncbi:MAG: hypothetical protein GOVbin3009_56 [Prokaryotic dsDNA virus sp.]|jgi:hypothetical protein|nr:MAG: hypothetical protein GOVbin3009_56 [Prokaryotic dsDNA virus sp.]|tara:strand:- start:9488 stop:11911 length:2424 start_codon:yes stop_codon:yes gene_type:complete
MQENKVTIFRNIKDTSTPFFRELNSILERIKEGKSKELIKQIRSEKNKEVRQELKKNLPAICFSGTFNKRNDDSLIEHSGFICLDFDGYKTKKDMMSEKERISKDRYTYAVFVSPSGNGLKVLVKIPKEPENHKNYFLSLDKHFNSEYFDKTSKNLSRVCYESYDPLIHINTNAHLWTKIEEQEYKVVDKYSSRPTIPVTDENKIVDILMKWWTKKYGLVEGERNNNVYILAAAFNDYGVNKSLAEYIMSQFESQGFSLQEIKQTINSAYTQTQNFGSKYYEDEDRVNQVRMKLKRGVSKKEIRLQLADSQIEDAVIDSVINTIEEDETDKRFWTKSEKGVINIIHYLFRQFLEDNGFYKFCPEGSRNFIFVRVTNNLIDHTSEEEIKDFVLGYLEDLDDMSVYNYFADKTRFFREEFLSLLGTVDVYFIEDDKDTAYLYYRNCAVKVTKDKKTTIDYLDLGGYVWKDQVIDRDFDMCESFDCDYKTFISNIAGGNKQTIKSMRSTIGYMLHGYKNLSYCPAIILNDEVISDNPEGGTGKGLFINGLSQMKKLVVIDGKAFNFEKSFAYQLVSADTQILCFDDVKKHFDFERLFSVVTEGLTLEKKNKDAIKIPFKKSPKVSITTNYAIKGRGASFERRKWELEFKQFYTKDFTPLVEFGKLLFSEWNEEEWCAFDNYMVENLMFYLSNGLIKADFKNLTIRKLSADTCHEFIEWCGLVGADNKNDSIKYNEKIYKNDLYLEFIDDNPDFAPKAKRTISRTEFYRWLNSFALYKTGIKPDEGRDLNGRWIIFLTDKTKVKKDEQLVF